MPTKRPPIPPAARMRILSLGAGVQSSTLALMAAAGEIGPMPDCAIFADTQAEPAAVYKHLDWLCSGVLPFPVHRVTEGSLLLRIGKTTGKGQWPNMPIPAFLSAADGSRAGLANRSCTRDFKLRPIRRKQRELVGLTMRRSPITPIVEEWIGISRDEAHRMKPSRDLWVESRWPLIEAGMSRQDCLAWIEKHGYPRPPKSSCTFCPFHGRAQWEAIKADPEAWAQAVEVDLRIRNLWHGRVPGELFLHGSLRPLEDAVSDEQGDLFGNDCGGICGV